MPIWFILKGFLIGFAVSIPVGPIALLCIRRTLAQGRLSGMISGLGASTADGVYSSIAALGLTFVSDFVVVHQLWFRLIGGIFLCYLGFKTFITPPPDNMRPEKKGSLLGDYISMFFLTLTNPMTVFAFATVFAIVGVDVALYDNVSAIILVLGVVSGSAMWWITLTGFVSMFRTKCTPPVLQTINHVSGVGLAVCGIAVLASAAAW